MKPLFTMTEVELVYELMAQVDHVRLQIKNDRSQYRNVSVCMAGFLRHADLLDELHERICTFQPWEGR